MTFSRLSRWSLISTVLLLFCSSTFAHGPTRQKVSETIEINAPAETVWALIANFSQADAWMSGLTSSQGEGGNEPGATRTLNLTNGKTLVETLKKDNVEKRMYSTKMPAATNDVTALPVTNYSSAIQVKDDGGTSIFVLNGAFYRGLVSAEFNQFEECG